MSKPGKSSKEIYEVGEEVLVQNIKSKLWDQREIISEMRLAHDGRIVSYELEVNGHNSTRHIRYLRKIPVAEAVATSNSDHSIVTYSLETNQFKSRARDVS